MSEYVNNNEDSINTNNILSDEDFLKSYNNLSSNTGLNLENESDSTKDADTVLDPSPEDTGSDSETDTSNNSNSNIDSNENNNQDINNETTNETSDINYEELYAQVLQPLKANGTTLQIKSVDELRTLAQMGANYTKKMASLKPKTALLKALENNGINDPETVNFMIDLLKGNKDALVKHIKDKNIDIYDINVEENNLYSTTNYIPSVEEMEREEQFHAIYSTPSGKVVLDSLANWDERTKLEVLVEKPEALNVLIKHAEEGIFQQVTTEIERRKMLGYHYPTVSNAYFTVLKEQGLLNNTNTPAGTNLSVNTPKVASNIIDKKPQQISGKKVSNESQHKINNISSTRAKPISNTVSLNNGDKVSDDDFLKAFNILRNQNRI